MTNLLEFPLTYILPLLFNAAVTFYLATSVLRLPRTAGTRALSVFILATSLWSIGYALEIASPSLEQKLFWEKIEYIGIVSIPPVWFMFAWYYADVTGQWSKPRYFTLILGIVPLITLILNWTNNAHGLMWSSVVLDDTGPIPMLSFGYGSWFWVNLVYSYGLIIAGSVLLVGMLLSSTRFHRWQIGLALTGILIPWVSNFLYITDTGPVPHLDLTPFAFSLTGILFFVSLYRFNLGSAAPIPHKAVLEGISDGIIVLDPQGRIVDLNSTAQQILNLPGSRAMGISLGSIIQTTGENIIFQAADEVNTQITVGEEPYRRPYNLRISPIREQSQASVGSLVVLQANPGQNQRSDADQAAINIQGVMDFEPDALLLVNREGIISLANKQAEQMFGRTKEQLCGEAMETLIPERFRQGHRVYFSRFFSNPIPRPMGTNLNLYALDKEGREFPVDISLSPLKTTRELMIACIIRDISERRETELALYESALTYQALFESANDAIFLLNLEGVHQQVNQKAADLLGYTREELVGMGVQHILTPDQYSSAQNKLEALMQGQTLPVYERIFRKKDGSLLPVEINVSLVRDSGGQPKYIQSIVRDITERKKAESEQLRLLEEIQKSREELRTLAARLELIREEERRQLAVELHDQVGQSLTGLNMNLQIIRHQMPPETQAAVLRRIDDSAGLLNETTILVRNVMSDLRPPMLDDYGLISALKWYGQQLAQRTGIKVQVQGDEPQPRLPGRVEIVLFRIIQEALNNTAKYAQSQNALIRLESSPQVVCLCVQDDGVGFNPGEVLSRNSRPHWGLLNMQERAASINGQLTIQSAPGKGTRVSIEIDRAGVNQ